MTLTINAPPAAAAPVISSLNPAKLVRSNSYQSLAINGSGFQSGSGLQIVITYPGGTTTVPSTAIQFVSSAQLKLSLNVGTIARTLTFQVIDPNGQKSNTVSLPVQ
jgi:hypothetical protein